MDVLIVYCDSGAPSRPLRFLEAGVYHQVLADSQFEVSSLLVPPGAPVDTVLESCRGSAPGLVAVMFDEFNRHRSMEVVDRVSREFPSAPVCAFGGFAALAPERLMENPAVRFMVVGEGEIALYELATALLRGGDLRGIRNLWYRSAGRIERNPLRPLQENLDLLPYPDRSLFGQLPKDDLFSESPLFVAASRGCPYECPFCYSPVLKRIYAGKGNYCRTRTAQNLVGEILAQLRLHPFTRIVFVDEIFPPDRLWLRDFARRMAPIKPPPSEVTIAADKCDDDILDQLAAAGVDRIVLGVETGSEALRRRIAARNSDNDRLTAIVSAARQRGLGVATTNMIGLPRESASLAEETYALNKSLLPDEIRTTVYQPVEGTVLADSVRGQKLEPSTRPECSGPDFSEPALQLPELPAEALRQHLYRMRFLDLFQKLQSLPKGTSGASLLHELPRARFRLPFSSALELGVTRRHGEKFGYLALAAGTECRFSTTLASRMAVRFTLSASESTLQELGPSGYLVADVLWEDEQGRCHVLFSRMVSGSEESIARQWRDCIAFAPEEGGTGSLILRVSPDPGSNGKLFLFWGAPRLTAAPQAGDAEGNSLSRDLESRLDAAAAEAAALRSDLERVREEEQQTREERDAKAHKVGELQIRILELEKQLEEQGQLLRELQSGGDGLGNRLKGIFRK